ncbi:hypothetical protein FNU76_17450 [Chitinimonas arctica]|uniref:DUF4157 domain-containing protein n=1 Tax=Chitinimonas arctica TaxID=2594795 RepID=A0A516SIL1_9NEIS|nr:hypothetical protein [Chitinimonas arctica]QDQ27987.1 hypothetical protein FNU76_17450 [Chitinimonas arctica]
MSKLTPPGSVQTDTLLHPGHARAEPRQSHGKAASTTSPPLQTMGELRYHNSPLQRRTASHNGIGLGENAAVARLSGGRVDLHALGASVQRVPASDPRLKAVGARSLAQGRQALISNEADRGHEMWHLAQQAMGKVRADSTVAGQGLNTQPALEREADQMGARITGLSAAGQDAPVAESRSADAGTTGEGPIQRRVPDFQSTNKDIPPPTTDLLDTLNYSYFTQTQKQVKQAILDKMVPTKASDTPRPSRIEAEIGKDGLLDSTPKRKTHKSGMVGKFGVNEFGLRSGGTHEVYEGGHLIPHELWSDQDPEVDEADDYVNLVPMSRNMNVGHSDAAKSWANIEAKLVDAAGKLTGANTFSVAIDITHDGYNLSYNDVAKIFNLTIKKTKKGTDTFKMFSWLPSRIAANDITKPTKPTSLGFAVENELHDAFTPIKSSAKLIEALKRTPIWGRMSDTLKDDIAGL